MKWGVYVTKVDEVGNGVKPGLDKDEDSGKLVQVDVMVQWQPGANVIKLFTVVSYDFS